MHTAPARMMSSAQTVAKMGRRIKKSTNVNLYAALYARGNSNTIALTRQITSRAALQEHLPGETATRTKSPCHPA